jgi:hypothetical protein
MKENIFALEMGKFHTYFILFGIFCLSLSSCVEEAKPDKYQIIRLYTDLPTSFDKNSFRHFGRKEHIDVKIYYKSTSEIIKLIQTKKWECGVDAVILRNALDLLRLKSISALHKPKNETEYYQGLLIDPYVFRFPQDTVPLFSTYGQIFRSKQVKINPRAIQEKKEWANLVGGLTIKYPKLIPNEIYNKIMRSDSLKGKDLKYVEILPYSLAINKSDITFPDQYSKGSVGKISGMALIRQAKYNHNARLLYEYCKNQWWRDKLAKKLGVFPYRNVLDSKSKQPLLFQELIKNEGFIKKIAL